jgi:hypothetical protein
MASNQFNATNKPKPPPPVCHDSPPVAFDSSPPCPPPTLYAWLTFTGTQSPNDLQPPFARFPLFGPGGSGSYVGSGGGSNWSASINFTYDNVTLTYTITGGASREGTPIWSIFFNGTMTVACEALNTGTLHDTLTLIQGEACLLILR